MYNAMRGTDYRFLHNFSRKNWRNETTWKTKT